MKVEENAVLKDINLSAAMKKTARNIAWRMYKSRGPKKKKNTTKSSVHCFSQRIQHLSVMSSSLLWFMI